MSKATVGCECEKEDWVPFWPDDETAVGQCCTCENDVSVEMQMSDTFFLETHVYDTIQSATVANPLLGDRHVDHIVNLFLEQNKLAPTTNEITAALASVL